MSIYLAAPYGTPTKNIHVRNPELNDGDTIGQTVKFERAMDGTIYSYIYTPPREKFTWHFAYLTLSQAQELQDFLLFCQGLDIQLIDFNGNGFKVRCLNPTNDFTTTGPGTAMNLSPTRAESLEIDLQFEVVP